jgi:1,2-dihydroxy-3-keto-5-methylthiopentene dioxygenase
MGCIRIQDQNREIHSADEMRAFLKPFGIWFEQWNVERGVGPDAPSEEILAAYKPEVDRLKAQGGYITADVINVTPDFPNLDAMLNKFNKEHTHAEDEVRFVVKGRGIFTIHPDNGPVFAIQVDAGDLINVPAGMKHWFDLCSERTIRAIRLFKEQAGWTPAYIDNGVHARYQPICLGPTHIPVSAKAK